MHIAVRRLLQRETREPSVKCFGRGNRPKMGNYFESFRGCLHCQPTRHIRTDFCPDSMQRNRMNRRVSSAAQCALRPGVRGWRRHTQNVLGCRSAWAARPAPRDSALRVSAVTSTAWESPARARRGTSSSQVLGVPRAFFPFAQPSWDVWAGQVGILQQARTSPPQALTYLEI